MDEYLRKVNFKKCEVDDNLYVKRVGYKMVMIILYIDDLISIGTSNGLINQCKVNLKNRFEMIDLGLLHYYLDIKVQQQDHRVFISQNKYATELIKKFGMEYSKITITPMEQGCNLS